MIADALNLTLKKLPENILFFPGLAVTGLVFLGVLTGIDFGAFMVVPVLVALAAGSVWGWHTRKALTGKVRQICTLEKKLAATEEKLAVAEREIAARTTFFCLLAEQMNAASLCVCDAAEYLKADGTSDSEFNVEKDLLVPARKLEKLSLNVVEISRLKNKKVSLVEQDIDPVELLEFCMSDVDKKMSGRAFFKIAERPHGRLVLKGDLCRLKQALGGLLDFAVRTGHGSKQGIVVRMQRCETGGLVVSVKLAGYHLTDRRLAQLCEPFGSDPGVLELTLAIARYLVKLHGGDIVIEEQPATGTVLALCLPQERISQIQRLDKSPQCLVPSSRASACRVNLNSLAGMNGLALQDLPHAHK